MRINSPDEDKFSRLGDLAYIFVNFLTDHLPIRRKSPDLEIFSFLGKQTALLLPLEIPFSECACDVTQVKKRWECSIGEITFLAKIAYSTI